MTRSFAKALPALVLLAIMMASGNIALGVFAVVQEGAKAELGLSDVQMGLIQGLATSVPLALLSIPFGLLVDKTHRIRLLALTAAVWTIGTLMTAYAGSITTLFVARVLAGLGANISTTIAISIAADLTMPEVRGRSLLLLTIGKFAGNALAFALGGWLLGHYAVAGLAGLSAWRSVHLAIGLGSAALLLLVLLMREPVRMETAAGPRAPVRVVAAELWARRAFLLPLFAGQTGALMADAAG
ncbi:MFS transporter, partial [Sphingomonas sp. Leaf412]|uniref:MFS transporter n=1 Tax=Sphingomonas sp. Leaf412 TaxID=1736370 RepID=UPI0012E343DD